MNRKTILRIAGSLIVTGGAFRLWYGRTNVTDDLHNLSNSDEATLVFQKSDEIKEPAD